MADVYELNTITELLKVPPERLDACLRDLRYALELWHFAGGEDAPTMAFDSFTWTDDGQHNIDMSMNGEPFLKLNVTDDAALSHAAGQDGEKCREQPEPSNAIREFCTVLPWRRAEDLMTYVRAYGRECYEAGELCRAASGAPVAWIRSDGVTTSDAGLMRHWETHGLKFDPLIRALSRGVPEGDSFVSCTCHEERQKQLCLNKHRCVRAYPLAAIAAQRKEG